MIKKFIKFLEDAGAAAPAATSTVGVAGAGDNPEKIVPVKTKPPILRRKLKP